MKKIGLIGDPHAYPAPVEEALTIFKQEKVDAIWCTGDIAGYGERFKETLQLLQNSGCQNILGNHEINYLEKNDTKTDTETRTYLNTLPRVIQQTIEGKRIYMVHASPPYSLMDGIRLLDKQGCMIESEKQEWMKHLSDFEGDVLIVGHTHQVFAEMIGSTFVINPGSSQFNHSCAVLSLPDLTLHWFSLSGQPIVKSWNWGMEVSSGKNKSVIKRV